MTRLLYWNLDGLTLDTVADPLDPAQSASRRQLIRTIFAQASADIIVVGAVRTAAAAPGQLANGAGYSACRVLLQLLQGVDPTGDWRLVPPLVVGTGNLGEGVAVYYRGAIMTPGNPPTQSGERIFTGPRRWGTTIPGSSLPRGSASAAGTYPAPQAADFGTSRAIPAGAQYNAPSGGSAPQENRLAAGIDYYVAPFSSAPPGPVPLDFTPLPQPYFCSFCETNLAGAVQRNLSLIAVHANVAAPLATLNALAVSDEAASPLGANETRVVLGDFNVNLLNPDGSNAAPYARFVQIGYAPALDMPVPAPAHLHAYMSYAATRLRDPGVEGQSANFFFSNGSAIVEYPGFGYFGSESEPALFSTDNILVWKASPPTGGYPVTIANVCVGTPYQDPFGFNPQHGPPVVPLGAIPFGRQLLNPLPGSGPAADFPWSTSGEAPQLDPAANAMLMSSANYGQVRSTSGHFAVVADV